MRSQLCLAARAVIRDSATNAVSVFQLLDNISPLALPLMLPDASVLAVWEREEGDPDLINLEFTTHNNGTQVNATQVILDWPAATVNRFIINLAGLERCRSLLDARAMSWQVIAFGLPPLRPK